MSLGKSLKGVPLLSSAVWHVDHHFDVLHDLQRQQSESSSDMMLAFEALERVLIRLQAVNGRMEETNGRLGIADTKSAELLQEVEAIRNTLGDLEARLSASIGSHAAAIQRTLGEWSLQPVLDEIRKPNKGICVPGLAPEDAEPEPSLLQHLTAEIASMSAVDVGANTGGFTRRLLDAGCEVYAVEPAPGPFQELQSRFGGQPGFHALAYAIGASDGEAELNFAVDVTEDRRYSGHLSLYSSLTRHSMLEGMEFSGAIKVETRRLDTLVRQGHLPVAPGFLKIDTEGCDLDVIQGMGTMKPEIVQVEFWDPEFVFSKGGARNWLSQTVPALRALGYARHLVIARPATGPVLYYANMPVSIPGSWGNAIFFRRDAAFQAARRWCENLLTPAYLYR